LQCDACRIRFCRAIAIGLIFIQRDRHDRLHRSHGLDREIRRRLGRDFQGSQARQVGGGVKAADFRQEIARSEDAFQRPEGEARETITADDADKCGFDGAAAAHIAARRKAGKLVELPRLAFVDQPSGSGDQSITSSSRL
jgi:hypothetical protein